MKFGPLAAILISAVFLLVWPSKPAIGSAMITPLAIHAHRYQDFQKNAVACEIFGEVRNTGDQPIRGFTLNLEMLDSKGKVVSEEALNLELRVIVPGNAKGEIRSVNPHEIGNFIQDTRNCPDRWLEGRIKYRITKVEGD